MLFHGCHLTRSTIAHKRLALPLLSRAPRCIRAAASTASPPSTMAGIKVTSDFDSGNIELLEVGPHAQLKLNIRPDPYCETDKRAHFQWFNLCVEGAKDTCLTLNVVNAGQASYPPAWKGYQACCSYDRKHWFRVPTTYDSAAGVLTISHAPEYNTVQYAYFAPFTHEQHRQLIARMQAREGVMHKVLGRTLDGRDMDLLRVGQPGEGKRSVWIIARQHPGETQAEYFMEGLMERLTCHDDPISRSLLDQATFYLVPNMNPDGSVRGHLRTNAAGVNLNRAWAEPNAETSPEVLVVLEHMKRTGVDLLVDVHGDEELPHCFVAGNEGIPRWDERLKTLQADFCDAFKRATPAFQTKYGYPVSAPGKANLTLCSKQIGQQFDCLALTLEMPFKDCVEAPSITQGWSPASSAKLGADMLSAVHEVMPRLR